KLVCDDSKMVPRKANQPAAPSTGEHCWRYGLADARETRLVTEDACGIPRAVRAACDIVAEEAVQPGHSAPVAGRMPPGINAGKCRFEHILAADDPAPGLRHDFGAGGDRLAALRGHLMRCRDDVGMVLPLCRRLAVAMALGVTEECPVRHA